MGDVGLVVCLEATAETIAARLADASGDDERPLLNETNPIVRIRRLKSQRAALYSLYVACGIHQKPDVALELMNNAGPEAVAAGGGR